MRRHLTYANVVATLALFLVVGGSGAYAAAKLARNSVGSKQIKDHSVALRDLARNVRGSDGLQGPKGDPGPAGPAGATGAAGKDLSFDGVRLGGLERNEPTTGGTAGPDIALGDVAGAHLAGKCYKPQGTTFTQVFLRRDAGATGPMLVYGGTDGKGFRLVAPGESYLVDDKTNNGFDARANQWAITVATPNGEVHDVRGLIYRQPADASFAAPAGSACFFTRASVERATR